MRRAIALACALLLAPAAGCRLSLTQRHAHGLAALRVGMTLTEARERLPIEGPVETRTIGEHRIDAWELSATHRRIVYDEPLPSEDASLARSRTVLVRERVWLYFDTSIGGDSGEPSLMTWGLPNDWPDDWPDADSGLLDEDTGR